jgi:Protein of unknown function (DUF4229)
VKRFNPVVLYTSSRIVLFIVTALVLALFGMHGVLLLLVAVVVSGLLSYVLLSRQRDAVSAAVVQRSERGDAPRRRSPLARLSQRMDERTRAEDAEDDARRAAAAAAAAVEGGAAAAAGSADGEADSEQDAIGQLEPPGVAQHGDEVAPGGAGADQA